MYPECDDEIDEFGTGEMGPIDIPDMDQIIQTIQNTINEKYPEDLPPEFKPSVKKTGIDLEGTLPYSFFVPPITPFGILYLILRLAEYGETPVEVEEQCDEFGRFDV